MKQTLKPAFLQKKKRHKTVINEIDYEGILQLTQSGFTLQETLTLLENEKNKDCFREILSKLEDGIPINNFFATYIPKKYRLYFRNLIIITSFKDAIALSYNIVHENEQTRKVQYKSMIYPILLFISTLFGLLAFNELCFPPLLTLLESFQFDSHSYHYLHIIIRIIVGIIVLLLLIFMIIFHYYKSHLIKLYKRFRRIPFVSQFVSIDFIQFFLECTKLGISTRDTLSILKKIDNKPLVVYLASTIETQLLAGENFIQAFKNSELDEMLNRFITIAYYSTNMDEMLITYLSFTKERILKTIKKLTYFIQIFSYSLIGVMLIFIYQILLLPMDLLTKL